MAVNPYIQQQANAIQAQGNQNLAQNVMPGIRSGALAAGQYGGSRQGIAEGVAAGNAQTGIAGAQANLYASGYNTDQANETQRTANQNAYSLGLGNLALGQTNAANNYNLGVGNLGLGYTNSNNNYNLGVGQLSNQASGQNQNFYTAQRGQDLQQMGLGASLYGQGITGQTGVGAGQYGLGQTAYQAPLSQLQNYSNLMSGYSGLGSSQIGSTSGGSNGVNGAIGGALMGGQVGKNLGLGSWGNSGASNTGTFQQGEMGAALADKSWQTW